MSIQSSERERLLARAASADARVAARLSTAIDDFFLTDAERLDERVRAAIGATLRRLVDAVEAGLSQHAARLLAQRGSPEAATALLQRTCTVVDRLARAGLLRDLDLMREVEARVRQDLIADALTGEPQEGDDPGLLARLAGDADEVIARAALAMLAAEGRRRALFDGPGQGSDLPADLHHRLVWWTAAALRERVMPADQAVDRALAEAAGRSLVAHDEGARLEANALGLAAAIDADAARLRELLPQALADRRLALFIGFLAHALGIDFNDARAVVLDPAGDRLWLVLRALEFDRASIARIGLALAEGDARRDLEAFADLLDTIADTPSEAARTAVASLRLHPDFRAAVVALGERQAA